MKLAHTEVIESPYYGTFSESTYVCTIIKVDLDVDKNRDREIKFTDDDATSSSNKYRFWINNDRDTGDDDEAEDLDPSAGALDHSDSAIQCQRDLEDFSPLGFKIEAPSGVIDDIHDGTIEVSLAFKNASGSPALKLYEAVNTSGEFDYLDNATTAASQAGTAPYKDSMGEVTSGNPFVFPASAATDLIKDLSTTSSDLYLIFEGSGIGSAELVLRLKKGGATIGESSSVFLELTDIKKMYEHYTVGDTITMDVGAIPTAVTEVNGFSYSSSSPEEDDYILFVHGWRMRTWERRYFAETAYKRLFWVNYRGRFGFFSWPTEWCTVPPITDPMNYDRSEEKAWHSGEGLRNLLVTLDGLYPDSVRVMAHSMGNVVTSEALRLEATSPSPDQIAHTYIASQAASVAHAYDAAGPTNVETDASTDTPEVYAAYPPTGARYFRDISLWAAGIIVNFCNDGDAALSAWEINQDLKPDFGYDYEFVGLDFSQKRWTYDPFGPGFFVLDFPADTYQIYSFIAEARSLALGADAGTAGEIGSSVDLSVAPYSYGNGAHEHSSQFRSSVIRRFTYWQALLDESGIVTP